jgi:hypothetical protein
VRESFLDLLAPGEAASLGATLSRVVDRLRDRR